jgi:hypothetical protein
VGRSQSGAAAGSVLESCQVGPAGKVARGSPIVVGCTMIDMHVRTEVDDRFKVSYGAESALSLLREHIRHRNNEFIDLILRHTCASGIM